MRCCGVLLDANTYHKSNEKKWVGFSWIVALGLELERELDDGGALAVSGLRVGSMYGDPAEAGSLIQLIFFYPTVQKPLQLHRCRRCFKGTSHPPMNDRI